MPFNANDPVLVVGGDPTAIGLKRKIISRHINPHTGQPGWKLDEPLPSYNGRDCNSIAEFCIIKLSDNKVTSVQSQTKIAEHTS